MPTEQILPLALSGAEIKKAILDKISLALTKDCHLNDNLAYNEGFSFEAHIKFRAEDLGRKIEGTTDVSGAMKLEDDGNKHRLANVDPEEYASLQAAEANVEFKSTDPTSTRIETGQPVPVRVTDRSGKDEIRDMKYRRDAIKK